jgi:dsRNA-specific ribonuclease
MVMIKDDTYGQGRGMSKKEAEQLAAKETLDVIACGKGRKAAKC